MGLDVSSQEHIRILDSGMLGGALYMIIMFQEAYLIDSLIEGYNVSNRNSYSMWLPHVRVCSWNMEYLKDSIVAAFSMDLLTVYFKQHSLLFHGPWLF